MNVCKIDLKNNDKGRWGVGEGERERELAEQQDSVDLTVLN